MLIRIFKSNQPALLIALPVIGVLVWLYGLITPPGTIMENPMPLYKMIAGLIGQNHFISGITGLTFLISGAFMISYGSGKHEISKRSFLPGLLYIIMSSVNAASVQLHPVLISNLFLFFAVNRLLEMYRREDTFSEVFDAGFLIAIAALFYSPCLIFLLLVFIALLLFHPFIWREWLIAIIGFILPFLFLFVYYYLADTSFEDFLNSISVFGRKKDYFLHYHASMRIYLVITGVILFLSILSELTSGKGIKLKTKKGISFNYWYLAVSVVAVLSTPFEIIESTLIAAPLSVVFANYLLSLKKNWIAELIFVLLAASSLVNLYHPF